MFCFILRGSIALYPKPNNRCRWLELFHLYTYISLRLRNYLGSTILINILLKLHDYNNKVNSFAVVIYEVSPSMKHSVHSPNDVIYLQKGLSISPLQISYSSDRFIVPTDADALLTLLFLSLTSSLCQTHISTTINDIFVVF